MDQKELENMLKTMEQSITRSIRATLEDIIGKRIEELVQNVIRRLDEKISEIVINTKKQKEEIDDIKKSQQFINDDFEEMKRSHKQFSVQIKQNNHAISKFEYDLAYEQQKLEELEQYGRRDNLEFHGIPTKEDENINETIINLAQKLGVVLESKDISISHRLPVRIRKTLKQEERKKIIEPIIVRFTSRTKRNEIYKNRTKIQKISDFEIEGMTELYINENLTKERKTLFMEAKKLKKQFDFDFLWTNMCQIFARKNSESKVLKICNYEDLDLFR